MDLTLKGCDDKMQFLNFNSSPRIAYLPLSESKPSTPIFQMPTSQQKAVPYKLNLLDFSGSGFPSFIYLQLQIEAG